MALKDSIITTPSLFLIVPGQLCYLRNDAAELASFLSSYIPVKSHYLQNHLTLNHKSFTLCFPENSLIIILY